MAKNAFVRGTVLHDVRGRLRYATSPDKQEHLEAYVDNMPKGGWLELSKYSRAQAELYHPGRKACEARELIIQLPNDLERFNPEKLATTLRDTFSQTHKVPCAVALHWNKAENNYHAHLIFSERTIRREKQGESIATRNTYFNAEGKRSTKKECVDENGELLPGCRFVKKGEVLSEGSQFGPKQNKFAQEEWMHKEKERLVEIFNINDRKGQWKVYDWKKDPHFPYIRIVKGDPEKLNAWRERENEWRRMYNNNIDRLIDSGEITEKQALELKLKAVEYKSRLRRARTQNKERWIENWEKRKERAAAEREYYYKLKKKSVFGLAVELALTVVGVDTVKLQTGVERTFDEREGDRWVTRHLKMYTDVKVQEMIDAVYRAAGRRAPSEEVLLRAAEGRPDAIALQIEIENDRKAISEEKKPPHVQQKDFQEAKEH